MAIMKKKVCIYKFCNVSATFHFECVRCRRSQVIKKLSTVNATFSQCWGEHRRRWPTAKSRPLSVFLFTCHSFSHIRLAKEVWINWTVMDSLQGWIVLWTLVLWIVMVVAQEPSIMTAQGEIRGVSFWVICGSSLNLHF